MHACLSPEKKACSACLKSSVECNKMVSVGSIKMHQSGMHDCLWWLAEIHSIVELSSHVTKSYFPVCHSPVCIQGSDLCSAVLHFNENSCTPCLSAGGWLKKGRNMYQSCYYSMDHYYFPCEWLLIYDFFFFKRSHWNFSICEILSKATAALNLRQLRFDRTNKNEKIYCAQILFSFYLQ